MAQVIDLRGRPADRRTPILLDPSGARARALAWAGRAVALVFLLWLLGLLFAGLGLLPSGTLPLGPAFADQSPAPLRALPRLTQPNLLRSSGSALGASTPSRSSAAAAAAGAANAASRSAARRLAGGKSAPVRAGSGHPPATKTGSSAGSPASGTAGSASNPGTTGHSSAPPGKTRSQSTLGHTKSSISSSSSSTATHGQQTTTSSTTPGNSGSASGQIVIRGIGRGSLA